MTSPLTLLLLLLRYLYLPFLLFSFYAVADPPTYGPEDATEYDRGKFGRFPEIHYQTTRLVSPHVLRRTWAPYCDAEEGKFYLFAPYAFWVGHPGPTMLDHNGQMVWHDDAYGHTYGLDVQEYRGKRYLTWWHGDDRHLGHGIGHYFMLDENYRVFRKVSTIGEGIDGDLHEFRITKANTALMTSYVAKEFDLSAFNKTEGWIWDCYFQETNLETNEVSFLWKASDHFDMHDCFHPISWKGSRREPWDWYHLNAVDKDDKGNYLVSARYCNIVYVSGKTGEILWRLGGANNSFTDLSNGTATNFTWQHHARWSDNYRSVTLFDNRSKSNMHSHLPSRGLKIRLDQEKLTAEKLVELAHPEAWEAESQGSFQELPNGNFLVGYGHAGAFTEFAPNGTVLCDVQYAPMRMRKGGGFTTGTAQSYRTFKQAWVGRPYWNPKVYFPTTNQKIMWVSWNGATEVRRWRLEGSRSALSPWKFIEEVQKDGFESNFTVTAKNWRVMRLTALDKYNRVEGIWSVYSGGTVNKLSPTTMPFGLSDMMYLVLGGGFALVGFLVARVVHFFGVWIIFSTSASRFFPTRRKGGKKYSALGYDEDDEEIQSEELFVLESKDSHEEERIEAVDGKS